MLTAARIPVSARATGALTDATPGSRSSTLSIQPTLAELARQHPPGRAEVERQQRTLGHDPAQAVRRRQRHDTAAPVALADVQLHALAGVRRAARSSAGGRARRAGSAPPRRAPSADQAEAEAEPPGAVASQQAVRLERDRQAVGGRPRQAGRSPAARPASAGPLLDRADDVNRLVEHPDARYAVHNVGTVSQHLGHMQAAVRPGRREDPSMPDRPPWPEKVWERHVVHAAPGEPDLLYIDLHLVHEVTSPQAFDGLRLSGRARAPPRAHRGHRGPQRPDRAHRPADRRPDLGQPGRGAAAATPPSSASPTSRWATPARASST